MSKSTITFRADSVSRKALDQIAEALDRDRSFVINEALRAYIEAYRWQVEEIERGIKEADAGDFASTTEVQAVFSKLKRAR